MIISIFQVVVSIFLIVLILLQERSAGVSGIFGGEGEVYHKRRGLERLIFGATIVLVLIFTALSIARLVLY